MEEPAFWRDLQAQFLALPDVGGGRQLDAIQGDDDSNTWRLSGGPVDPVDQASLRKKFSSLAKRGGIGIGATGDQALSAWLNLLLQKSPRAYTTHLESIESTATDPRDLLVSQIQVPNNQDSVSDESRASNAIVVEPGPDGRYVVVAGHRLLADAVASGAESVSCRILESASPIEQQYGWIRNVCLASAELCTELETESLSRSILSTSNTAQSEEAPNEVRSAVGTYYDRVFRQNRDGLWEVAFAGQRRVGLKNLTGMELIRRLLANPGGLVSAKEIMVGSAADPAVRPDSRKIQDALSQGDLKVSDASKGISSPVDKGRGQLRERLQALQKARQSAREKGDETAEEKIDEEVEQIARQLREDVGYKGLTRPQGSDTEKARQAVSRRYSDAVKYLRKELPALAQHLEECIRQGAQFVYQPTPCDITWRTD